MEQKIRCRSSTGALSPNHRADTYYSTPSTSSTPLRGLPRSTSQGFRSRGAAHTRRRRERQISQGVVQPAGKGTIEVKVGEWHFGGVCSGVFDNVFCKPGIIAGWRKRLRRPGRRNRVAGGFDTIFCQIKQTLENCCQGIGLTTSSSPRFTSCENPRRCV